jgi:hypothetical protein
MENSNEDSGTKHTVLYQGECQTTGIACNGSNRAKMNFLWSGLSTLKYGQPRTENKCLLSEVGIL